MNIKEKVEILHWDTTWDELPDRIKSHFSDEEAKFYRNLLCSRDKWVDGCKGGAIKDFLENLKKNDNYRVYIKSENANGPYIYWFTSFVQEHDGIAVRLPTKSQLPGNPPECVREVYRYIGGIDENLDYYCGWDPPEEVKPMSESGWDIKSSKSKDAMDYFILGMAILPDTFQVAADSYLTMKSVYCWNLI